MASKNERQRWSDWFDALNDRFQRQKDAITRLVLICTQQRAALLEIAALPNPDKEGLNKAIDRAQQALDLTESYAAPTVSAAEELRDEPDPQDPRKKGSR